MHLYHSPKNGNYSLSSSPDHRTHIGPHIYTKVSAWDDPNLRDLTPYFELAQWCEQNVTSFWCLEFNFATDRVLAHFDLTEDQVLFRLKWA